MAAALLALSTATITWFSMPLLIIWSPADGPERPPAQGPATLPAVVGAPALRTPLQEQAPIGAASVLYTSNVWFSDSDPYLGLVGSGSDIYRVSENGGGAAGLEEVLSPDGTRVASTAGLLDLATGAVSEYPRFGDDYTVVPQAWSPDGTTVAVLTGDEETIGRAGDYGPSRFGVSLLTPSTGAVRELAAPEDTGVLPGWAVAFSPNGSRLAFQTRAAETPETPTTAAVRVVTLADGTVTEFPLPAGSRLAGKGAWTPDGGSLLLASGAECGCGDYPVRWTITTVSVTDGSPAGPVWTRDGVFALRVLGWWPSGSPVAAEYTAADGTGVNLFGTAAGRYGLLGQDQIGESHLIELNTGRVLLAGAGMPLGGGDVESFDVAGSVLGSGAVRPGDPPLLTMGMLLFVPLLVFGVSIAAVLTLLLWWIVLVIGGRR